MGISINLKDNKTNQMIKKAAMLMAALCAAETRATELHETGLTATDQLMPEPEISLAEADEEEMAEHHRRHRRHLAEISDEDDNEEERGGADKRRFRHLAEISDESD